MSKLLYPFLVFNLASEALFVLDQRLTAQQVAAETVIKILSDMIEFIFSEKRVALTLAHERPPELDVVRKVISAMANCSIMKVTGTSMEKLLELIIAMVKFQVVCATQPEDIKDMTLRHLEEVAAVALQRGGGSCACRAQVEHARGQIAASFSGAGAGELHHLRQGLLQVLQEQRTKVAILVEQSKHQTGQGVLTVPPPWGDRLGTVILYDSQGTKTSQYKCKVYDFTSDAASYPDPGPPAGTNLFDVRQQAAHRDTHTVQHGATPVPDTVHPSSVVDEFA